MIPGGTRFIGISESVNLTERKSSGLNAETQPYTMDDITSTVRPYKVFTALLTQNGGDGNDSVVGDQTINVGVTYIIDYLIPGDNLIPYGAPNNEVGTSFVCNQEISNWGNPLSQLSFNSGAPIATVLENTIGNVWFTFQNNGEYFAESDGLFIDNKTATFGGYYDADLEVGFRFGDQGYGSNSEVFLRTNDGPPSNSILQETPIEIRVYS